MLQVYILNILGSKSTHHINNSLESTKPMEAVTHDLSGCWSFDAVWHDHEGSVVATAASRYGGALTPELAEALSLRWALQLSIQNDRLKLILDGHWCNEGYKRYFPF